MMTVMKKALVLGKDIAVIEQLLKQEGFEIVLSEPDVVVTHGGDGYLLEAERAYPGIPKLPIRYNSICKTCIDHDTTHAIKALGRGTISQSIVRKLSGRAPTGSLIAINEISLHHVNPYEAIRFQAAVNGQIIADEAIGDGLVVATAFGSRAYFHSITRSLFDEGIGIAFNNTTEQYEPRLLDDDTEVGLIVRRGPAYLVADNNPHMIELQAGDSIRIQQSTETATILGIEQFHCPDCDRAEAAS
jgi:NAD kinase